MCLAIVFRWNEISSKIFKENLNLGTNIRLPEIKYFTCPKILTDTYIKFQSPFREL